MPNHKQSVLELLRQRAEKILLPYINSISEGESLEVKKLLHELQMQQLELEMQNDELQIITHELEQQRIKFANLFELAPAGYFVINKSGIILDVNQAGLNLLAANKASLINKPLSLHVHKDDTNLYYKFFNHLITKTKTEYCNLRLCTQHEKTLDVMIQAIGLQSLNDEVCYLTVTDITGLHEAEQKLENTKKTLDIALSASLTGIWEINIFSGEIYLDDFCTTLYGFNLYDFDHKYDSMLNRIHQNDRKNVDAAIRQTIINEKEFNIKFRVVLPEKTVRYLQGRAQIIKDQHGKSRFVGTFTDISEKTAIEQETARFKNDQQQMILSAGLQAEENEKKRISEVLHNGIAQMLYGIKLNLDQLKITSNSSIFENINQLLNQSIQDIRNISFELAPSILTDFGLAVTLEDMALRLQNNQLSVMTKVSHLPKNLDFQLQLNIFRIVQELINNSIKHANASKITIEVSKQSKLLSIVVTDNGNGFKTETDPDTKTPKGIGLSSIKNRLRLYNGTIKIETNPGSGTQVQINLKH